MGFTETEVYRLHEVVVRLDRIAKHRLLRDAAVTYHEFLLLMAIRESADCTQQSIADGLDTSRSLISQRVASLVAKGLMEQRPSPESRRENMLRLTAAGKAEVERIYAVLVEATEPVLETLGDTRAVLNSALDTINAALKEIERRPQLLGSPILAAEKQSE